MPVLHIAQSVKHHVIQNDDGDTTAFITHTVPENCNTQTLLFREAASSLRTHKCSIAPSYANTIAIRQKQHFANLTDGLEHISHITVTYGNRAGVLSQTIWANGCALYCLCIVNAWKWRSMIFLYWLCNSCGIYFHQYVFIQNIENRNYVSLRPRASRSISVYGEIGRYL